MNNEENQNKKDDGKEIRRVKLGLYQEERRGREKGGRRVQEVISLFGRDSENIGGFESVAREQIMFIKQTANYTISTQQ